MKVIDYVNQEVGPLGDKKRQLYFMKMEQVEQFTQMTKEIKSTPPAPRL